MRKHDSGQSPQQQTFLPPCLEDVVAQENPVRFIAAFVDSLNLRELGFARTIPAQTGRPPYSPRTLLKLYLYGHMNRIRSFRMLERECGRNIELWWLLDKLRPDHNTIAIFRAMNRKAVLKVFRLFVRLWAELGLCGKDRACVDGTTNQGRQRHGASARYGGRSAKESGCGGPARHGGQGIREPRGH